MLHACSHAAIILAISGVEAVANMTGIMVHPVASTARKSIWPVLAEIVVLNVILTLARLALPESLIGPGGPTGTSHEVRDTMMKVLASHYVGKTFASVAAIVFALLLLSAVNTAVTDLVSIQYMLARDKEMPRQFTGLNRWGMPLLPLLVGTVAPMIVVLIVPDVGGLADLYAIGVVGAVALNLGTTATNFHMDLRKWERAIMGGLALLMVGGAAAQGNTSSALAGIGYIMAFAPLVGAPVGVILGILALVQPQTAKSLNGRRHAIIGIAAGLAALLLCCAIGILAGSFNATKG